jgi:Flp pilus assembly protein TadD
MKIRQTLLLSIAALATGGSGAAFAQDQDARTQYQRDREYCREQTMQPVQTCLREAAAAYAEYRRNPDWGAARSDTDDRMSGPSPRTARSDRG